MLAARLVYNAALNGNISGMRGGDLGCGTGILSIWAALFEACEVVGIDADETVLSTGWENAARTGVEVTFFFRQDRGSRNHPIH